MSKIFLTIVSYAVTFYLGRLSILLARNKYLEAYEHYLKGVQEELKQETELLDKDFRAKHEDIKKMWQDAVVDISMHHFADQPSYMKGKWTSLDDQFLQSWMSAEDD